MATNISKELIQELEAKHQRVAVLRGKDETWEIVFRRPTRAEYKQYRARNHNPAQVADAQEILARQCCVYPAPEAFDALLEEWPAIPEAASEAFSRLLGFAIDHDSK